MGAAAGSAAEAEHTAPPPLRRAPGDKVSRVSGWWILEVYGMVQSIQVGLLHNNQRPERSCGGGDGRTVAAIACFGDAGRMGIWSLLYTGCVVVPGRYTYTAVDERFPKKEPPCDLAHQASRGYMM